MYTISGSINGETHSAIGPTVPEAIRVAKALIEQGASTILITRNGLPMKEVKSTSFGREKGKVVSIHTVRDARYTYPEERT